MQLPMEPLILHCNVTEGATIDENGGIEKLVDISSNGNDMVQPDPDRRLKARKPKKDD
jgi:hypothetical protein